MFYKVLRIEEDLDFGCEERSDNDPVMAVVTLLDGNGAKQMIKIDDAMLYKKNINEGDKVYFDKDGQLTAYS